MTDPYCRTCGALLDPSSSHCWSCQSMFPNVAPSPASLLHNRYRLLTQLGQGGMGTVFKALDTTLQNKIVAIKQVAVQQSIQQELALLPLLDHPHIPSVTDYFQEAGNAYLVMRYIEGHDLDRHLATTPSQRLPLDETVQIGLTLCDVLTYLHSQQPPIIFRDVKPGNVLLTPQGTLFLVDFGIARVYKAGQSKDTQAMGSPGYAPPEQYNRGQTDARSDLYALGALLYYLVTGDDPATHPFQFNRALIHHQGLREVLLQATQLVPAQRYSDVPQMKAALQACLSSAQPSHRPSSVAAAPLVSSSNGVVSPPFASKTSILWMFAQEDATIVKKLETHLSPLRRTYSLTYLHNIQEQLAGTTTEEIWREALRRAFLVGVVHSPYLAADDDLIQALDTLILPEAGRQGTAVVPLIGRVTSSDGSIPYTLQPLPRNRKGLIELGDSGYVEIATEFRSLARNAFGF